MNSSIVLGALLCLAAAVTVSADPGLITIKNEGGYLARAIAEWNLNGKTEKEDIGDFGMDGTELIKIPDGAKNVTLKVYNHVFLGSSQLIFSQSFPGPVNKCYKVWGTSLVPGFSSVDC